MTGCVFAFAPAGAVVGVGAWGLLDVESNLLGTVEAPNRETRDEKRTRENATPRHVLKCQAGNLVYKHLTRWKHREESLNIFA